MTTRIRPALAGFAIASAITAASAQQAKVYLFDRLEQPAYSRAWNIMFSNQRNLPQWIVDRAKNSPSEPGHEVIISGNNVELYNACEQHNCAESKIVVMFAERGKWAKGVLINGNDTPRFFGRPNAAESAALIQATQ